MKNALKIFLALALVLAMVCAFAACTDDEFERGQSNGGGDNNETTDEGNGGTQSGSQNQGTSDTVGTENVAPGDDMGLVRPAIKK